MRHIFETQLLNLFVLDFALGQDICGVLDELRDQSFILSGHIFDVLWQQRHHVVIAVPQLRRQHVLVIGLNVVEGLFWQLARILDQLL